MTRRLLQMLVVLLVPLAAGCVPNPLAEGPVVVTARFRDSAGLYVGNDVRVLGIEVGTVRSIAPRGAWTEVELELDPAVAVPADAKAVTLAPSLVTDRHVELVPAYTGGAMLAHGDVIPLERTRTPVELDQVVRAAKDLAVALERQGEVAPVADLLDSATAMVGGRGETFRSLLADARSVVDAAVDNEPELVELVRGLDRLMVAAPRNDRGIRSFSTNLTTAAEVLAAEGHALRPTLRRAVRMLDAADILLKENRAALRASLRDLGTTAGTLADREREMAETLDLLPLLFQNLTRAMDVEAGGLRTHGLGMKSLLETELGSYLCPAVPLFPRCRDQARDREAPSRTGAAR